MSEKPRFRFMDLLLVLLLLGVAGGVRAGYLFACCDHGHTEGPLRVQDPPATLNQLASNLEGKNWFGCKAPLSAGEEETAHTSPGYPALVALALRFLDAGDVPVVIRWGQCALGTLTVLFYYLFAVRAFRSRLVGFLAGLFCALHPFWVINTAQLADGVVATFLLSMTLYLGVRASQTAGALASLLFGLCLAALALVRAPLLVFSFVGLLWFLWRARRLESGWLCALVAALGFAIGLAPWTFRNYQTFGEPVPIVNSAYLHLWMGNNPRATGGPQDERTMLEALAATREDSDLDKVRDELAAMKQDRRYRSLGGAVVRQIRENPDAAVRHRVEAFLGFFLGESWLNDPKNRVVVVPTPVYSEIPSFLRTIYSAVLLGVLAGMLLLGLIGWRWTYTWRQEARPSALALFWVPLPYVLAHAESLSGPRLPLDGVLLTYAAFVVACLVPSVAAKLLVGPDAKDATENPA